jgi:hypothetical protein
VFRRLIVAEALRQIEQWRGSSIDQHEFSLDQAIEPNRTPQYGLREWWQKVAGGLDARETH